MKVILNKCYGGFGVSHKAIMLYFEKMGIDVYPYYSVSMGEYVFGESPGSTMSQRYFTEYYGEKVNGNDIDWDKSIWINENNREDPVLIDIVETLGNEASGRYAKLVVVEIPDELKDNYVIDEYDGIETLHQDVPCW